MILVWVIFLGLIGSQVRKKEVIIDRHIYEIPNKSSFFKYSLYISIVKFKRY
jgi:hypothetical protein